VAEGLGMVAEGLGEAITVGGAIMGAESVGVYVEVAVGEGVR